MYPSLWLLGTMLLLLVLVLVPLLLSSWCCCGVIVQVSVDLDLTSMIGLAPVVKTLELVVPPL